MASKYPYYPMYVDDFDDDKKVAVMNLAEVGLYQLALNRAWKMGSLPDDVEQIALLIRRPVKDVKRAWPRVSECWIPSGEPGMLVNPRQEIERAKVDKKSHKASTSATIRYARLKAANAERTQSERRANASDSQCDVGANAVRHASDSVSDSEKVRNLDAEDFSDALYARHPKKKNKPLVQQIISELSLREDWLALAARIDSAHWEWCKTDNWRKEDGQFCPKLDEWLSDEGYTALPASARNLKPSTPWVDPCGDPNA